MRRLLSAVGIVSGLIFAFITYIHPVYADVAAKACSILSQTLPRSDACKAEIAANPVPDFVRPVEYNPYTQGSSHPRSILFPNDPLPYEIGWLVRDWPYSKAPGADPTLDKSTILKKGTLFYIYATVQVKGFNWLLVGPDQWFNGEYVAVLHMPKRPEGISGRWITLDLSEQTLVAMIDDTPVFATLIAAGYRGFGWTREGLFHIYARTRLTTFRGPPWAVVPEYIIPHVPDVMFFDEHVALHGAYWHDNFGIPRSHGCVNIPVGDEAWLWDWVSQVSDQWGPDDPNNFFLPHPDKAPFVYVYRSNKNGYDGAH